ILAPPANDASLTRTFVEAARLHAEICRDVSQLSAEISRGCGAIILAEEVLNPSVTNELLETLRTQPSWSDIPITLVCSGRERSRVNLRHLHALGPTAPVALIERPFRPETLVSMLEVALRSRERQYQVRDLVTAIATNEARLRRILEQTVVGIAETDLDGRFLTVNDRYCAIVGRTREELLQLTLPELTHPEDHIESVGRIQALAAGEETSFIVEKRVLRPDGAVTWVHDHLAVMRNEAGEPCGIAIATADITERRAAEAEIARARDEAVAASRAKDEFLASLSHELRTPLNPVLLLASEGAQNADLPPAVQADFETIARNVALEARLIDDLLDLTRITRGKLQIEPQLHSLHVILEDAIATVLGDFNEKQITLVRRFNAQQPTVNGDGVRLQQVFWNVLKNAVKFTPARGTVTVETRISPDRTHAAVAITDTGIGMNDDELSRIFDAFVQGDHAGGRTHHFGGLGLGLAISKRLVDLHGGRIRAESPGSGSGSTFTIELPVALGAAPDDVPAAGPDDAAPESSTRPRPKRILLVDDHEATRTALAYLLQRRNFAVSPAGSLTEALTLAERGDIDLIVSDIGLPDGTGYDLMEQFGKPKGVKGIALTGYGMEQDMALSERAGFAAHLTKPVRIEALDEALKSVLAT
ncbi:MAG TPA: ATP-binding protein, partial [Opitutus sp.]|nr:ATP-binding protein [Opitutus sp.]